jgi:alpha-ketoglutarate-dependent taurine dioxygenase
MHGVTTRLLEPSERELESSEPNTPWVVEARQRPDVEHLQAMLAEQSNLVLRRVAEHGAVLFRGFDLESDADFERAVLSIRGMRGIASVFMSEEGRTLVPGTRFVLHTNSIYTTGGSFDLGFFHSENYFVPDVPRFIFFFCRHPSPLGGETGVVNTAKVFQSLPARVRTRLRSQAYLAGSYPFEEVRARYGLSEAGLQQRARERGLTIESHAGKRFLTLYKPSVLIHPETGEAALAINYYNALLGHGFRAAIQGAFQSDYAGPRWSLHRLLWQRPALTHLIPSMAMVRAPRVAMRNFLGAVGRRAKAKLGLEPQAGPALAPGVEAAFEPGDGARVAQAIRASFSSFRWRSGDMLMIDNLKMAHAGMPGMGPRLLRAMICNPIALPLSAGGSGEWAVPGEAVARTVGDELSRAA